MRGPRVCTGRHGGNIGAFENKESCRGGAAAAGSDIDNHWHRRLDDLLHDLSHRGHHTAGRAQFDQNRVCFDCSGVVERALNAFSGRSLDGVVHHDLQDVGCGGCSEKENKKDGEAPTHGHTSHSVFLLSRKLSSD